MSYKLKSYANCVLPMRHYVTTNGECVEYEDVREFTRILFKAFKLDKVAIKRYIDIALTLDGSTLT